MPNSKQQNKVTVCVSGDIDFFEIETVEGCLGPLFQTLDKYGVKMTIPITAKAVKDYPERAAYVLEHGHEVAVHGDIHESFYGTIEEQAERLEIAKRIFRDILGIKPLGFRAPRMRRANNTYTALEQTGFLYDSSRARSEILLKIPLFNRFSYDMKMFPLAKSPLRLYAATKYRHTPARPFLLRDRLVELPVTGPPDYYFILSKRGPGYPPGKARRIAEIWLDIVGDMKRREDRLFILQAHPYIMSPRYVQAIDLFLEGLADDGMIEYQLLGDVARASFAGTPASG